MRKIYIIIFILLYLPNSSVFCDIVKIDHVQVELMSDKIDIMPGQTFLLTIHFKLDDQWHIYGQNPGDAGIPTKVEWILPNGFTASEIKWPQTKKIQESDIVTVNVYDRELILTSKIKTLKGIVSGRKELIEAKVTWLSCKEVCVPGEAKLSLFVTVKEKDFRLVVK